MCYHDISPHVLILCCQFQTLILILSTDNVWVARYVRWMETVVEFMVPPLLVLSFHLAPITACPWHLRGGPLVAMATSHLDRRCIYLSSILTWSVDHRLSEALAGITHGLTLWPAPVSRLTTIRKWLPTWAVQAHGHAWSRACAWVRVCVSDVCCMFTLTYAILTEVLNHITVWQWLWWWYSLVIVWRECGNGCTTAVVVLWYWLVLCSLIVICAVYDVIVIICVVAVVL